jgi:hypothetical protein
LLERGAEGFVAQKIVSSGRDGSFRGFDQIEAWAARVGNELVKESSGTASDRWNRFRPPYLKA